jgi:hypothetical protein
MKDSITRIDVKPGDLTPSPESVARYLGGPEYRLTGKMRRRVCDGIDRAVAMVNPVAGYRVISVEKIRQRSASGRYDSAFPNVAHDLAESSVPYFAVYLATLGDALESAVRDLGARSEMVAAMALDAIGTAMLDTMGRKLEGQVDSRARRLGFFSGCRIGPGLNGADMENQVLLFSLLDADTLGVSLNASLVMQPAKSISAFVIFNNEELRQAPGNKCSRCQMKRCQFRLSPNVATSGRGLCNQRT